MRKMLVILLSAVLAVSAAYAGGNAEQESGPVTLQVWHRWSGDSEARLNEIVAGFEAANPDIDIEVTAKPGEYIDLLQQMIADLAAGNNPPDILLGGYNLMNYIATELKPNHIDDIAPSAEAYEALTQKFDPAILNLGKVDGEMVCVPFCMSNMVMFVNMDILREAGLSEDDIPETWDDVFEVGEVIKANTDKYTIGLQMIDTWPDLTLIFSNGGKLLSDDGSKVAFNNPEAVEAIEMWQRLYSEGLIPVCTDNELFADFIAGEMAFYCASCMKLSSITSGANFELQVAMNPAFEGKQRALPAGGSGIFNFSKDERAQDAAWKFIEYALSAEAMNIFTKTGYLSVTTDEVPITPGQEAAYEGVPYAVQWICWPGGSTGMEIDRLYYNVRTDCLFNGTEVGPAFDEAVKEYNAML